ncbi:MmgE/PrpD family protein [Pseudomonas sp. NPDC007930]|uniref:MmgE/PrpD family protein n=1 Tax=Pseudomonas sp. NPDC007930 TaxID=3364417 RepID=UPI0036E1A632
MRAEPMTLRLAKRLVALRHQELPAEVLGMARTLLADTLLVALAGQAQPAAHGVRAALPASAGRSHLWFAHGAAAMAPADAAFINTLHAGLLGYGSINARVHADAVCLPAAWAMAEQLGRGWEPFVLAFVAASEVVGRFSHSASPRSAGWSHSSIYGGIGAAIAAGLLLELPAEQLAHAIGLAMAQAAGTQQASLESVLSRRLQPAFATRNGVFAAQLAAAGVTAARQAVEGRFGFRALYEPGNDKAVLAGLGSDWRLLDTALKPYPVSACSQAPIEALLGLVGAHGCGEQDVLELVAYVSPFMFRYVGGEFSANGDLAMLAQFNLRYHLASVLLRGPLTFEHLQPAALQAPAIATVLRKVHLRVDPRNSHDFAPATVAITLRDGRVLEATQPVLPGSRGQPMGRAACAAKAAQCGALAGVDGHALWARLAALAEAGDWHGLAARVRG